MVWFGRGEGIKEGGGSMVSQLLLRQQATKVAQLGERDPYSTVAEK